MICLGCWLLGAKPLQKPTFNVDFLSMGPLAMNSEIWIQKQNFISSEWFENVIHRMVAILFRPQGVNPSGVETGKIQDN